MALQTAKQFGLPKSLLRRANDLSLAFQKIYNDGAGIYDDVVIYNDTSINQVTKEEEGGNKEEDGEGGGEGEDGRYAAAASRQYSLEHVLTQVSESNIFGLSLMTTPSVIEHKWKSPITLEVIAVNTLLLFVFDCV